MLQMLHQKTVAVTTVKAKGRISQEQTGQTENQSESGLGITTV